MRWGPAAAAVARRPDLWPTAVSQAARLAPPAWWRRWPPNPLPAGDYLHFRLQTMYGDGDAVPGPTDVIAYLEWCRRMRSAAR